VVTSDRSLGEVLFGTRDLMLRLGPQPLGIFTKPPRAIGLTQTVPFGEHSVAPVMDRDERVEREENVLMAGIVAALAEKLPLQLSRVRVLDMEEDIPVRLGQRRGPCPAFAHHGEITPERLLRQRSLGVFGEKAPRDRCCVDRRTGDKGERVGRDARSARTAARLSSRSDVYAPIEQWQRPGLCAFKHDPDSRRGGA
jgi:hypothetical protein